MSAPAQAGYLCRCDSGTAPACRLALARQYPGRRLGVLVGPCVVPASLGCVSSRKGGLWQCHVSAPVHSSTPSMQLAAVQHVTS